MSAKKQTQKQMLEALAESVELMAGGLTGLAEDYTAHRSTALTRHEALLGAQKKMSDAQIKTGVEMKNMSKAFDKSEAATEKLRDELQDQGKLIVAVNGQARQNREIADAANKKATTAISRLDKINGAASERNKKPGRTTSGPDKWYWTAWFFVGGVFKKWFIPW